MDTRTKILTVEQACARLAGQPVTLVTGYFDVLRASHIRELRKLQASTLLVLVRAHADSVLPLEARAELVAALRMVDYVVTGDDRDLDILISTLRPSRIAHREDADLARASQLKQHVQYRQSS